MKASTGGSSILRRWGGSWLVSSSLRCLHLRIHILLRFEARRVAQLVLRHVHGQFHTVGSPDHFQLVQLESHALFAEAEEAADADHESFNVLAILAENKIADASNFCVVWRVHR